jgi:flagellar hook-associated protein 2
MGSVASSLGSSSAGTDYFTGMSTFSSSLNTEISQEVQIASLPYELLQNDVATMTNQSNELQTLDSDVGAVETAVAGLASAAGNMLSASVSDPSVATATVGSGAIAGSYSLQVTSLGSYSDALSNGNLPTVTDPASQNISSSGSYTLTVGTTTTPISYSGGNLNGLAQAINDANAGVEATVVDVGSNSAPDYVLSLQSDQLGPVSMQLNDGTQDLLPPTDNTSGTLAQYSVNGQSVQSDSDSVTLAPGLTVQLTGTNPSAAATVTVAADPSSIGNAMRSFVSAYNAAIAELGKNRGQSGGALAGDSIVYELTDALQGLANYSTGYGAVNSLATLGVTFNDTTGQLSFDQSAFDAATSGQTDALTQFLGSATGGGFLETATNTMTALVDPNTGVLTSEISTVGASIASTNTQIANEQAQVNQLQTNLTQQMAAADAMIYDLQQQTTQLQGIFTAEQDSEIESASV